ncbi:MULTISPECIES: SseB family protein [unclassified Rathayibacter]|uniref:SseB family protein n=1 Tax=unclassified Rathayibacter TaxID=2609250 RepID=UPI00188A21F4|nr:MULTISPECIES: SseB family protein [unclassified Rathayibacter]MBF4463588.1 SseB family protein [Rathayibacter sp. VKM Ac-2879]MBF4504962.1 SseB family protein [Rathayibacter sp. VKM Ac-2878]
MSPPSEPPSLPAHLSDSAGTPWAGRRFSPSTAAGDDGSAPEALARAWAAFGTGRTGPEAVVDALRDARLLIPLVAHLGEEGEGVDGLRADKSQELAIVTVAGPDGRTVLPVFSSVEAMRRWDASARPVPVDARRAAVAAVAEGTEVMVLDPASEHEFVVRRPALWAIAEGTPWRSSPSDLEVLAALRSGADREEAVVSLAVHAGDPAQRLRGAELVIALELRPGLDEEALHALLARLGEGWAADEVVAARVDSMTLQLVAAPPS